MVSKEQMQSQQQTEQSQEQQNGCDQSTQGQTKSRSPTQTSAMSSMDVNMNNDSNNNDSNTLNYNLLINYINILDYLGLIDIFLPKRNDSGNNGDYDERLRLSQLGSNVIEPLMLNPSNPLLSEEFIAEAVKMYETYTKQESQTVMFCYYFINCNFYLNLIFC